ncbi:MAG: hypothetical protein NTW95_10995 [Candidatus Aminicenantes bacterium]|nr:hypothetical protein [Candidatus Aminicenantes bacterium]
MKKKAVLTILLLVLAVSLFPYSSKLEEKLFYSLGHFGATFLYQTYLNIGMISDIWTHNIYSPEDAKSLLGTNLSFLQASRKNLQELTEFSINNEDRGTFMEMIAIVDELTGEADYMLAYVASRSQDDIDQYEVHRKQAWAKITKLMDIK